MANEVWYALKVRPRLEKQVSVNLSTKGYELFLPLYKRKSHWSDRIKTLEVPLFPGYLFCQFDVTKRLPILQTPGVISVVGIGKCPEPIDVAEIDAIRTVVSSGVLYQPHPYLTVGDMVRVEHGALSGLVGLITQVKNDFRLIISVNLLMRSVSVEIDRSWVDPVRSPIRERSLAGLPEPSLSATGSQNKPDWQYRRIV
jgi:transcription antitermination factor NusG